MNLLHEKTKAVIALPANNHGAGTVNGTVIDAKGFKEILFVLNSGTNQATGTVDVKVQTDSAVGFSSPTDLSGATFTQITTSNDNEVYLLSVLCQNTERYLRLVATVANAECDFGATGLLCMPMDTGIVTQENTVVESDGY